MKHKKTGRVLSRNRSQRKALLKTMLGSLIVHEKITTTEAKAKELKNHIDQIINKAKVARTDQSRTVALIRDLRNHIPVVAQQKLLSAFGSRFDARTSGYTRIIKLEARKSDAAKMAIIEFV